MAGQDRIGSFIVRIYGDAAVGGGSFVGMAEDIESGGSYPFRSPDELWTILTADHCENDAQAGDAHN